MQMFLNSPTRIETFTLQSRFGTLCRNVLGNFVTAGSVTMFSELLNNKYTKFKTFGGYGNIQRRKKDTKRIILEFCCLNGACSTSLYSFLCGFYGLVNIKGLF
jgi:hypothetical protein